MVVLGLRHSDVGVASGLLRKALTGQGNSGIMPFACRDMCLIAARKHLTTWHGQIAQLVEHTTENRSVGGSIPPLATTFFLPTFFFNTKSFC